MQLDDTILDWRTKLFIHQMQHKQSNRYACLSPSKSWDYTISQQRPG